MDPRAHEPALGGPGAAIDTPAARRIHADCAGADFTAPRGHSHRVNRRKAIEEHAVAQGDSMKSLFRATDVDAGDDFVDGCVQAIKPLPAPPA